MDAAALHARLLTLDERQPIDDATELALKTRAEFIRALFG